MASDNGRGKVVLPMLALGGIALWINYYYRRRPTVDDTNEDYLSQLPDDVLRSIIGNLTARDAAKTTILSTRWKYLLASIQQQQLQPTLAHSMPTFKFRCLNICGVDLYSHRCCPYYQEKDKFMNGLYQFLRLYSGHRVAYIALDCCFAREFPSGFTHWFQSLSKISVERLHLSFECLPFYPIRDSSKLLTFSLEVLSQTSSVKHLFLSECIVLSSPKVRFYSIMTLALRGVVLTSGHLEGILSSCSNLKELTIKFSKLPYKLRLTGTVKIVVILECDGGKDIELHAAYLHTLECKIKNKVRFFFSFVPMLENLMVCPCWERQSISYIFGDRARYLPDQVKSLTLKFVADEVKYLPIEIPTEMKMFRNIRNLSLILVTSHAIVEIFELSALWGACPRLQNFSLVETKIGRTNDVRGSRRPPLSPTCHTELKQVTYGGFDGSEAEMKFVLSILRSAIVLEQMFLSPGYKDYFSILPETNLNLSFDERKRNSIQQKLHGQAISRKAVVIIE